MRNVSEHQRIRVLRCIILTIAVSFMFLVTLHQTSNTIKTWMFSNPQKLQDWDDHIQIAVLLKGLNEPTSNGFNLREKFRNFVKSLVIHTEKHPLRLIFITDLRSVFQIEKTFEDALPPFDLENKTPDGVKVQRFSREYVQVEPIIEMIDPWTATMKKYFNHANEAFIFGAGKLAYNFKFSDKYNDTIYYISPYYHKIFPKLNKLIVMDTDMEFRIDPAILNQEFEKFHMDHILGCGNDLAPHYNFMLNSTGYYKRFPDSNIGTPGQHQGLNMGVLLLRLDRMRKSNEYNHQLTSSGVSGLAGKYGLYNTALGAQDWLTLLSFEDENLVFSLDCKFNRQLNLNYFQKPWLDTFWDYHSCHGRKEFDDENTFIAHLNGNTTNFADFHVLMTTV